MDDCCPSDEKNKKHQLDFLLLFGATTVGILYFIHIFWGPNSSTHPYLHTLSAGTFELMNEMWLGIALGLFFAGMMGFIPRETVQKILGKPGSLSGILRATAAGFLFDLCNHGILMLGAKIYERGASIGQVMAFLIASPWNSFSLTFIMVGLIGIKYTLLFILISMVIAIISGILFDHLMLRGVLPKNPNSSESLSEGSAFREIIKLIKKIKMTQANLKLFFKNSSHESRIILRWIFIGVVISVCVRAFMPLDIFQSYFGSSALGLIITLLSATVIEVCSEGSTPIAAEIFNRAAAPGNSLLFLMAGVSTDYTEIMILKDTTKSWKISLFLPLITLPQIIFFAWLLNTYRI